MTPAEALPGWAALLVAFCVLCGASLTLAGAVGVVRFRSFFERIHAPTLATSFGAAGILLGSMIFFSVLQSRPVLHEVLIFVFVTVTTPVTLMLLARAALFRNRAEGNPDVPSRADMLSSAHGSPEANRQ